jgi:hypothetical protein
MDGDTLSTFIDELNGGDSISNTLKFQLVNAFKAMLEAERPWMPLRKTDTSKSVTTASTWQTAIDLSTLTRFNRFYGKRPIRLFDGTTRTVRYRQVPFDDRLEYKDSPNTFVYDENTKTLYLNGTVEFAGTLYIRHLTTSADIAANSTDPVWPFPSWSHAILGFGAVAMHKGGIDYDDVNARTLLQNNADAMRIMKALEKWDDEKQLSEIEEYDPAETDLDGYRSGAINMNS